MGDAWTELRALNDRLDRDLTAALAREAKLRRALQEIAAASNTSWLADTARTALADIPAREERACPRCHGEGVVEFNPSPRNDPQLVDSGRCDVCHGTGTAPSSAALLVPADDEQNVHGPRTPVITGCPRCHVQLKDILAGRVFVSPRGMAHHPDGGMTRCGIDAAGDLWWRPQ